MIRLLKLLFVLFDCYTPAVFVIGSSALTQHNTNGSFLWSRCAGPARTGKPKEATRRPLDSSGSKTCQHGTMAGVFLLIARAVLSGMASVVSAINGCCKMALRPWVLCRFL